MGEGGGRRVAKGTRRTRRAGGRRRDPAPRSVLPPPRLRRGRPQSTTPKAQASEGARRLARRLGRRPSAGIPAQRARRTRSSSRSGRPEPSPEQISARVFPPSLTPPRLRFRATFRPRRRRFGCGSLPPPPPPQLCPLCRLLRALVTTVVRLRRARSQRPSPTILPSPPHAETRLPHVPPRSAEPRPSTTTPAPLPEPCPPAETSPTCRP